jgi:HSP20 family protein
MRFHSLIPRRSVTYAPLAQPGFRAFWPAEFDRLFDEAWRGFGLALPTREAAFAPRVDVSESDEAYTVRADLPGLEEKDIQVSLEEGVLTIQGKHETEQKEEGEKGVRYLERAHGSFHRSIQLPAEVDADKVSASYRQGVLTVTLPKRPEAKPEVRTIPIKTS